MRTLYFQSVSKSKRKEEDFRIDFLKSYHWCLESHLNDRLVKNSLLHEENVEVREGIQGIIGDGKTKIKYDDKF